MERRKFGKAGRKVALGASLVFAATGLTGCADLMAKSAVAPSWFQAKAVEVKGEGYPDIHKVPMARTAKQDQPTLEAEDAKLKTLALGVDAQVAPIPDADTIRATAAQMRAQTEQGKPASDAGAPAGSSSGTKP